jgi:sugar lactone lactonase YvrE
MAPGDLSMPRGIAIDSKDRLLIADTSRGAVQAYSIADLEDGDTGKTPVKLVGSFSGDPGTGSFLTFPNGMAIDGQGKIYVTDRSNNRVQIWKY